MVEQIGAGTGGFMQKMIPGFLFKQVKTECACTSVILDTVLLI